MKSKLQDGRGREQKNALIVTTVSGFVPQFEMNNVRILQELGYQVYYASNFRNPSFGEDNSRLDGTGIVRCQIDLERSPFRVLAAVRAYRQLKRLMREVPFELLHCHTPMGGVLARLAAAGADRERGKCCGKCREAEARKRGGQKTQHCRVIYTAHGFHFYKGAPLRNWLLYYPAERWLARYTDVLITINSEDYRRAKSFRLRNAERSKTGGRNRQPVFHINGVGIDLAKYREARRCRCEDRKKLGVAEDEFLLLSVGELSRRKNHRAVVRALAELAGKRKTGSAGRGRRDKIPGKWKYIIAGSGSQKGRLNRQIRRAGLQKNIVLAGYREDVEGLLAAADCFVFPSKQEGLPVALLEAAAAGLPCIASDIRGNREVVQDGRSLFDPRDLKRLETLIASAYRSASGPGEGFSQAARAACAGASAGISQRAGNPAAAVRLQKFDQREIRRKMRKIYEQSRT